MKYQIQSSVRWMAVLVVGAIFAMAPQTRAQVTTNGVNLFEVGTTTALGAGDNNLTVNSINPSQTTLLTSGAVLIGGSTAGLGGTGNSVTLSNVLLTTSVNSIIGEDSSNNVLKLLGSGTVWNGGGGALSLQIGNVDGGSGNPNPVSNYVYVMDGALLENTTVWVGATNGAATGATHETLGNGLIVSNGGYAQLNGLSVGGQYGTSVFTWFSNNFAYVSNTVNTAGAAGISTGHIGVGSELGVSNYVVLANVMWNGNGSGGIDIGFGRATTGATLSNSLTINNGSMVTNMGSITVGLNYYADYSGQKTNIGNGLTVAGPGTLLTSSGMILIGGSESGNGSAGTTPNGGSSNNYMQVLSGGTVLSTNLYVGAVFAAGNGSFLASPGTISANANSVQLSGAGTAWTNGYIAYIGYSENSTGITGNTYGGTNTQFANNNSLVVGSGATFWSSNIAIGAAVDIGTNNNYANNNSLVISNGGKVVASSLYVGYTNSVYLGILGSPAVLSLLNLSTFQTNGSANSIATGNAVLLTNNSVLEIGSALVVGQGGGNTVSNFGSTFQFTTNSPTVTPVGVGSIYMNNGTVSFSAINNADVTNNLGNGALSGILFTGQNTFELNAASNTTAGQSYTFGTGQPNGASNYVNLLMENGSTAYRGGAVTIGTGGSLLVSNTSATFSSAFTDNNLAIIASNSTVIFSSGINGSSSGTITNSGMMTVNGGGTYNGSLAVTNAGVLNVAGVIAGAGTVTIASGSTLEGSGAVSGQIINSGVINPNSGSALALTGSELVNQAGGLVEANNGTLSVAGAFTNNGTLRFVNSVGTFNSAVVNNSTWVSDPSIITFSGTFSNGPTGVIISTNDTYVFKSNFVNQSTQNLSYNTQNANFIFSGTGSTQVMQVAGLSLGGYGSTFTNWPTNAVFFTANSVNVSTNTFHFNPGPPRDSIWGFTNNFAVASLTINNTTLELGQQTDDSSISNGLYVGQLVLGSGGDLIISNNTQVYFYGTNGVTGLAFGDWAENPGADVLLLDGAGFHQLIVTPEPSILLLWVIGLAAVYYARRRKKTAPSPR